MYRLLERLLPFLNEWHEEEYLNVNKYIPANDEIVIRKSNELISKLQNIPKTQDNYGLIHGDLQSHNFNLADKQIVMFDFDEVSYNYYVHDLAVVLFQAYWRPLQEPVDKHAFVEGFLNSFLKGYNQEHHFQTEWFTYLADFLKIRHLTFYICFLQGCDLNSLSEAETAESDHLKRVITEDWPIVDFDFVSYSRGI
jgi:amicoumacin kinase